MLTDIQTLKESDVVAAVAASLKRGLDVTSLADFVASIDWSNWERSPGDVRGMLGKIEAWLTECTEGELSRADLVVRLLSFFVDTAEKSRRVVFTNSDELRIIGPFETQTQTITELDPPYSLPTGGQLPQSEPDTQYRAAVA